MLLEEFIEERFEAVHQGWFGKILELYPADGASFLKRERDRFANPVGITLELETKQILRRFLQGAGARDLVPHLESIIRITAVQEFEASQALTFVFLLKDAVRDVCSAEFARCSTAENGSEDSRAEHLLEQWTAFDRRVDGLLRLAIDVYASMRERIFKLRVDDVKRQVSGLMRRIAPAFIDDDPEVEQGNE